MIKEKGTSHTSIYGMLAPTRFSRTDRYFRRDEFFIYIRAR